MMSRGTLMFNLKELRKEKGLSQIEIANITGVTVRGYGKVERGEVGTTVDTLDKIADGLGVSVMRLLMPPQADFVDVVRCSACIHYDREKGVCNNFSKKVDVEGVEVYRTPYDFCSDGEKLNIE